MERLTNQKSPFMASMPVASNPKAKKTTLMLLNNGKVVYRLEVDESPDMIISKNPGVMDEATMDYYWHKERFHRPNHTFYGDDD